MIKNPLYSFRLSLQPLVHIPIYQITAPSVWLPTHITFCLKMICGSPVPVGSNSLFEIQGLHDLAFYTVFQLYLPLFTIIILFNPAVLAGLFMASHFPKVRSFLIPVFALSFALNPLTNRHFLFCLTTSYHR